MINIRWEAFRLRYGTQKAHHRFCQLRSESLEHRHLLAGDVSAIQVDKYLWDINGSPFLHSDIHVGDELIYSFDVTNVGETKLTNVELSDSLPGVVLDEQVAVPFTAYEQPIFIPTAGVLGVFSSLDRTYSPWSADPFEAKAWDNFSLSTATVIEGLSWDGAYFEPFATGVGAETPETDFLIEVFSDNSGKPGALLHQFEAPGGDAGIDDTTVRTTLLGHQTPSGGNVYHYDAMLPFTALAAGDYWLSITALQTFPSTGIDPTWQWHLGTNEGGADGFYYYDDTFDDPGDNDDGLVNGNPFPAIFDAKDLSFELHAAELVDFNGMLNPGEKVMFMGTYYVTQDDVNAGEIVNKATVTAVDPTGEQVMGMDELTIVVAPVDAGAIEIDKFLWDINGSPNLHHNLKVGDELIYSFNVENTGDLKLSNVTVVDPLPGLVMDEQVAETYVAYEQPSFVPADGNLGPYASVDRSYVPISSDPFEAKAWDNFTLVDDIVLDAVSFTGAYVEPFPSGAGILAPKTDFLIEFFTDDSGLPGSEVFSFQAAAGVAGVSDANVQSTLLAHTASDGGPAYDYMAMIPFTLLPAGDYWISITALQIFPNVSAIDPTWQWQLGTNPHGGDGFYYYDDTFDDAGDGGVGLVDGVPRPANAADKDLSFTLHAAQLVDFDGMLDPGETVMFMGTYHVTEEDIQRGRIDNWASATGTTPDGTEITDFDEFSYFIAQPIIEPCVINMGDADGDGVVGFTDFLELSKHFGQEVDNQTQGDFDCDGTVTFADFLILSRNYGKSTVAAALASADIDNAFADPTEAEHDWIL